MYVCNCCNLPFEDAELIADEYLDCRGSVVPNFVPVSPCCKADFSWAFRCSICDAWISEDQILIDNQNEWICQKCDQSREDKYL